MGSNLGDRQSNLAEAVQQLRSGLRIDAIAPIYETDPVGFQEQPLYLNTVLRAETAMDPQTLLDFLKGIERRLGRQPSFRNAPRPIDLDILLYDDLVLHTERVTLPHPRMHERAFVLAPLAALAPDLVHPTSGRTVSALLEDVDQSGVRRARRGLGLTLERDVQGELPDVGVRLQRVGVTELHKSIRLGAGKRTRFLQAELSLLADIGPEQKGLHMSRFSHALDQTINDAVLEEAPDVESLALRIAERVVRTQGARRSEVSIRAGFVLPRHTPVSGLPTEEMYTLLGRAVCRPDGARRMVGVEVDGMTACPCAMDMIQEYSRSQLADAGFSTEEIAKVLEAVPTAAHNQRSRATLILGTDAFVRAQDLVEIAEASMSSENYGLLKRQDEFFVVHKAHRRPRFVEDVVREMLSGVVSGCAQLADTDFALASVTSYESIHKHNAYAEGSGTLGELRMQILEGQAAPTSTTLEQWLG